MPSLTKALENFDTSYNMGVTKEQLADAMLVVEGATVECKYGSKPATLVSSGSGDGTETGGKVSLTVTDIKIEEKDFGICEKLLEKEKKKLKKEGKSGPALGKCKPNLIKDEWTGGDIKTKIDGENALHALCKLTCKEAESPDTITITSNGQDGSLGSLGDLQKVAGIYEYLKDRNYRSFSFPPNTTIWLWLKGNEAGPEDFKATQAYNEFMKYVLDTYGSAKADRLPSVEEILMHQAIKGTNYFTGKELSWFERFCCMQGLVTPIIVAGYYSTKGGYYGADDLDDAVVYKQKGQDALDDTDFNKKVGNAKTTKIVRTQAELDDLAKDPAHNNKITKKGIREREVGLALEEAGEVSTLRRDPTGASEFLDASDQKWDVKGFYSDFAPIGYNLESALENIRGSIAKNENVMLDTGKMYPEHVQELLDALTKEGLIDKIKVWPK